MKGFDNIFHWSVELRKMGGSKINEVGVTKKVFPKFNRWVNLKV